VFVLLPRVDADAIRDTLASHAAAQDTITQRPEPQTPEGRQAKQGMQSRVIEAEQRLKALFSDVVSQARVFQGGGNELTTSSLRSGVEAAAGHSLSRLFPKFAAADDPAWAKVVQKVRDGAPDALAAVGWGGEVPANPVCKEVLAHTPAAGTKGSEVQQTLGGSPYGWPKDAVDGALLALLASGHVRAERDGHAVEGPKELPATQIGKATFFKEDDPPTKIEQIAVRGVLEATKGKVLYTSGKEAAALSGLIQYLRDLAASAGGAVPLPEPPDTAVIDGLAVLAGNQQFRAVAQHAEQLRQDIKSWSTASDQRIQREGEWAVLARLLVHAAALPGVQEARGQRDAIDSGRQLLADPNPIAPLIKQLCGVLRAAIAAAADATRAAEDQALKELEASAEWQQLDQESRDSLLAIVGLSMSEPPDVASDDVLLKALDATPLAAWAERRQAVPAKAAEARALAVKKLEPKAITVKLPNATLKSEAEVETYTTNLRTALLKHVADGETVII
jgi:hypothetical protein